MSTIFVKELLISPTSFWLLTVAQQTIWARLVGLSVPLMVFILLPAPDLSSALTHDPTELKPIGCRAGMTFVQLAFRFCRLPMTGTLSVRFDNQGLLKKQSSFQKFALAKYSAALHSEWDAIISVYNLMDKFPQLPVLEHVLCHQDKDLDYEDLPGALATMELNEYSTPLPQVPFDLKSWVMILVDGITIT
jgi:hypothetical protein